MKNEIGMNLGKKFRRRSYVLKEEARVREGHSGRCNAIDRDTLEICNRLVAVAFLDRPFSTVGVPKKRSMKQPSEMPASTMTSMGLWASSPSLLRAHTQAQGVVRQHAF